MSKHEKLRRHILENNRCNPSGGVRYQIAQLVTPFGLSEREGQQVLAEMAETGLISLEVVVDLAGHTAVWSEESDKTFFGSGLDGLVLVRVLRKGAELLAEMPKGGQVGFVG